MFYEATYRNNGVEITRRFVEFTNACKWLSSHIPGTYIINGVEYSRASLREAITFLNSVK